MEDHQRLSDLVVKLRERYHNRIIITVIDPQSSFGLYKSLRHWVRKYPTFIIDGQQKVSGWDQAALMVAIEKRLAA